MIELEGYKDLGTMNSWNETPDEYKECCKAKHTIYLRQLGTCWNMEICPKCQIYFTVDSGD